MERCRRLKLSRPIVVLDTETTGAVPFRDRIVELAMLKILPDGRRETWERRINPEMRIPIEAIAIHGIKNEDVEGCPPFRRLAGEILEFIGDADLCGFNIHSFDLRILQSEFARCGEAFNTDGRKIVDVQVIYHRREPRDLTAAVGFYLDRTHADAHAALGDAEATLEVLQAQLDRYPDIEPTVDGLASLSRRPNDRFVDPDRRLEWRDGEACLCFGKHSGKSLKSVFDSDPDYISWILSSDFPEALKTILREAKEGRFPRPRTEEGG